MSLRRDRGHKIALKIVSDTAKVPQLSSKYKLEMGVRWAHDMQSMKVNSRLSPLTEPRLPLCYYKGCSSVGWTPLLSVATHETQSAFAFFSSE